MPLTSGASINSSSYITGNMFTMYPVTDTELIFSNKPKCLTVNFSVFRFHDDSKDVVSAEASNMLNNVVHMVCFPVLFFIGFLSNIVNMVVSFQNGLKQRINLCLFCLSLMDLIFVTLAFLIYVEKLGVKDFTSSSMSVGHVSETLIKNHMFGLYSGSGLASQFISAVIAGERCLCVVWPLRFSTVLKTKTSGAILLVGVLLIFAGRFVVSMKYHVVCVVDTETGLTSFLVTSSEFYRTNLKLMAILDGWMYGLCLPTFLCSFVFITTTITAANLQKSTEFQKESSSSSATLSARNIAVTRMLIYLSLQFIVLNTPNMLFRISLIFLPELITSGNWGNLYFMLLAVTELCILLNSSLNFVVYYFFGSKYRESVLAMVCRWRKVRRDTGMDALGASRVS
ncbi:hypothetical protein ACOMHN_053285 [Nucella lapillus]